MTKRAIHVLGVVCAVLLFGLDVEAKEDVQIVLQTGHTADVLSVAFSPDGRYIVSGGLDNTVRLWERETGKQVRIFEGHTSWVFSVAFSPDGRYIVSGIVVWNKFFCSLKT